MEGDWRQIRLLLWKDYLIRKRKLVTLGGVIWATLVVVSLVIVRSNIDVQDKPTCQFPARALPSAGMFNFLQSFICSINNECSPLDKYEEIPRYENSKIRKLERQFAPLIYNETILSAAELTPDALKLVATLAKVIDEPDFHVISRRGIKVKDLFKTPDRVEELIVRQFDVHVDIVKDFLEAKILLQNVPKANFGLCDERSVLDILEFDKNDTKITIQRKLCSSQGTQEDVMVLLSEVNFSKYIKMAGSMLHKLNGEDWLISMSDMASAIFRMMNIESFIPVELASLIHKNGTFEQNKLSYFNFTLLTTVMDLLEPTFGDTEQYKTIRGLSDTLVAGVQWLHKTFVSGNSKSNSSLIEVMQLATMNPAVRDSLSKNLSAEIQNSLETLLTETKKLKPTDIFSILTKLANTVISMMPASQQHEVLFYATLLTKLIEGTHYTVVKNVHMEEIMFSVTKRHPGAVKIIANLPPHIIGKTFDALSEVTRIQVLTSKMNSPGQLFCDKTKLQQFFEIGKEEAENIRKQLCTNDWKNYVVDVIRAFGIFDVRASINQMASLVIMETIGKDNTDQLYSIEKDLKSLENFVNDVEKMSRISKHTLNWAGLLNTSSDAELFKVIGSKYHLFKRILITVHGALAKEVIKQNPILEAKITPILIDSTYFLTALNVEIAGTPKRLIENLNETYPKVLKSLLLTLSNETKTYKILSTHSIDMMCKGVANAEDYFNLTTASNKDIIVESLCSLSKEIEKTMNSKSKLAKAVQRLFNGTVAGPTDEIHWPNLINSINKLFDLLNADYPYLFQPTTYGMNETLKLEIENLLDRLYKYWFDVNNLERFFHLSIKIAFRLLDLIDAKLFELKNDTWIRLKHVLESVNSLFTVTNRFSKLVTGLNSGDEVDIPELPKTVAAIKKILPNIPQLVTGTVDLLLADNTSLPDVMNVLNARPLWPCSTSSLADVLSLNEAAQEAVRGMETILCLDMKAEWSQFDDAIRVLNIAKTNSSNPKEFLPHLFLKVSSNLDELVDNIKKLHNILGNGSNETTGVMKRFWKAWDYAVKKINSTDNEVIFGHFFRKLDEVIDSIDTKAVNDSFPLVNLWEDYMKCSNDSVINEACAETGRAAYKYTLKFLSNTAEELVSDLYTYFTEVNEPKTSLLSIMGFTRRTPLSLLYNKLADFVGVLLNSYWDLGFMNQVRRASNSQFWDCDSLFESMVIPLDSSVTKEEMMNVKPYICPSVLFWISLPMGENILLDLVAKPQYLFFNIDANKLNSTFLNSFKKSLQLSQMLKYFASENYIKKRLELNVTKENDLENLINEVFDWKIDSENPSYRLFGEIHKKHFATNLYLTQVAMIVTKIKEDILNENLGLVATSIPNISIYDTTSNVTKGELTAKDKNDVEYIQKLFKRRPAELLSIHFDALTRAVWGDRSLLEALIEICNELKDNNSRDILSENDQVKQQFCSSDIKKYFENIYISNYVSNKNKTEKILRHVVEILEPNQIDQDIVRFFDKRQNLKSLLKYSVKYADDLGLELYLKYLSSNLLHYEVVLDFLTGSNWWSSIKKLYNGSYATTFFTALENGFVVAEDWITHVDKIKIAKLLKEINFNRTEILCYDNVSLAEYIPDGTGLLSKLKEDMCSLNETALFLEIPPLQFASQGYDYELEISRNVDYEKMHSNIDTILAKLELLKNGLENPFTPEWITNEKVEHLRQTLLGVSSKETLVKITFGVIVNIVDGVTLFMNSSDCPLCSKLTAWFKQINLQLIKKDEYDILLCHMHELSNEEIYNALKHDFHWDMAIQELISTRNYTNYELNKSINSFLDNVKLDVLTAMSKNSSKLQNCVGVDYNKNEFGNLTLLTSITSKVIRLLRSTAPHLKDIDAIKSIPYLTKMSREVAPRLHVIAPLTQVLANNSELVVVLQEHLNEHGINIKVNSAAMDLFMVGNMSEHNIDKWLIIPNANLKNVCQKVHCKYLAQVIKMHINQTAIKVQLRDMQIQEFWSFRFVTDILYHIERLLDNATPILGVASKTDMKGIAEGQIIPLLDFGLQILQTNTMTTIIESLQGVMMTLHPLLRDTALDFDLDAVIKGLEGIMHLKNNIVNRNILNMYLPKIIANPQSVETGISHLGLNNTNFWSMAAPKIMTGSINLNPLLESKDREVHVREYACNVTHMAKVIDPGNLDDVTADDVYVATIEQFCQVKDDTIKEVVLIVLQNINFTYIMDKMMNIVLTEVYVASNLTEEKGNEIISRYNSLMSLVPVLQDNIKNVSEMFTDDPFFQGLRNFSSVSGLLMSPDFLDSAGKMLCGKNLIDPNGNRFYKAIAETKDFSNEPDPMQLEVLPTDFCRSLYKDIIQMGAGKIIWSFIKPLMMGRILYTPETIVTRQIVQNANHTFARMSRMRDIVTGLSESFTSMDTLSQHKESVGSMKSILDTGILGGTIGNAEDNHNGDPIAAIDFDSLVKELERIKDMEGLVSRLSNLLQCVNMNRFLPSENESMLTKEAVKLTRINEFAAGIVFVEANSPYNVEYKIRMDIESVPTTSRIRNQFWTPGPAASFIEDMRYFRGFVQIQDLLDKAIIRVAQNHSHHIVKRDLQADSAHDDWALYTQQMPYPCYKKDIFQSGLYESQALIIAFFFSLILTVSSVVRFTVWEKESGNTKLMSVMGLRTRNHTLSWLGASLVEMLVTNTCMFVVLKAGNILPKTDSFLLWLMIVNFGFAVLMFCYMVSKLFKSASLASVCAGIMYLVSFLPFVIVLSMEATLSPFEKFFTSLSMSTAFSYSALVAARFEASGERLTWNNVWSSPDRADLSSVSAGTATLLVTLDALLYAAVGWLLNRLMGKKEIRDNLNDSTVATEKAGVSIVNVTKVYNEGTKKAKKALEGVSIELQKGQITTLLGQNGAGKTTLIKIITGMMKATSGHIVIRTNRAVSEGAAVKLGVCPQNDVLIESLTAVEHLRFYAQLKSGTNLLQVDEHVKHMVHMLSMGGLAYEPVHRLSGGLRRRLCVALAFIADPSLVLLDEPSSGVDPVARRDIWSLILKLKEDRTVLLTTHHLDEAELLSDQIVIMHKGQVHTTGSPLEIKRSLGNGYKLIVNFHKSFLKNNMIQKTDTMDKKDDCLWQNDTEEDKTKIDTCTKLLMEKVRSVIKNAQVVSLNEMEVEVLLPFFGVDGLNNDFLKLCDTLELNQEELKFSSYTVDCSSLEQVFFNVCQQIDDQSQISSQPVESFVSIHPSDQSSQDEHAGTNSTASMKNSDVSGLVPDNGRMKAGNLDQYKALLWKRWLHYSRNWWLLFLLFVLPTVFVIVAMGFSLIRPPPDNEIALKLQPDMYENATEFLIKSDDYSLFAQRVLFDLEKHKQAVKWQESENPQCKCVGSTQVCNATIEHMDLPELLELPDSRTLNEWIISTQTNYIEKRYGGWGSSMKDNVTNLIAWYNNKGHHAMPSFVNALNAAILRHVTGNKAAGITSYTHPLKISDEQLSRSTLLQHVADVGISAVILIAFSLVPAAGAIYLVKERCSQEKRLQLLCGVRPWVYWAAALTCDMIVIVLNIFLTICVLEAFALPAFVVRDNLQAICLLLFLFGFACSAVAHLCEKMFTDASLANMVLFCANVFVGVAGLAVLLILDIISDSELTDNARWTLHKIFMLSPQFTLGDGLVEIAKNSIQAQVLKRFGMDTYKSPLGGELIPYHYVALVLVGTACVLLNLAIEYGLVDKVLSRWRTPSPDYVRETEMEDLDVCTERYRVEVAAMRADTIARPTHLHTIGNINAGFVNTEGSKMSLKRDTYLPDSDVIQCISLRKEYNAVSGKRVAVKNLTIGIPPGQCLALLGENGAGKSTTFSLLTGQERPTAGQLRLRDQIVTAQQLCQGYISYCPQSDALDPLLTVTQILQFYCLLRGISNQNEVIGQTVRTFDLDKYVAVRVGTLSGGNKRKLCTAVALMGRTPLVLLDEPTSGMDVGARAAVRGAVRAACGSGRAVLLSTHALSDARHLAARLALLHRGRLTALAATQHHLMFGGGYVVCVRCGDADRIWRAVESIWPTAQLHGKHHASLRFLLPYKSTTSDSKQASEVKPSEIFRVMATLQGQYDIEDFTINQSSIEQMFTNTSERVAANQSTKKLLEQDASVATVITDFSTDTLHSVTSL